VRARTHARAMRACESERARRRKTRRKSPFKASVLGVFRRGAPVRKIVTRAVYLNDRTSVRKKLTTLNSREEIAAKQRRCRFHARESLNVRRDVARNFRESRI